MIGKGVGKSESRFYGGEESLFGTTDSWQDIVRAFFLEESELLKTGEVSIGVFDLYKDVSMYTFMINQLDSGS